MLGGEVNQARHLRIPESSLLDVSLYILHLQNESLRLVNLSRTGFAFYTDLEDKINISDTEKGMISFSTSSQHEFTFRYVHKNKKCIGCEILLADETFGDVYQEFLCKKLKNLSIEKQEIIEDGSVSEGDAHLFVGESNCELYYVTKDDNIIYGHIFLFGVKLEFHQHDINLVYETGPEKTYGLYVKTIVDYVLFLENVPGLDPKHKYIMVKIIGDEL